MISSHFLSILKTICDLPTAPLREEHVLGWIAAFVETLTPPGKLECHFDRAGNLRVDHIVPDDSSAGPKAKADADGPQRGAAEAGRRKLAFEAHLDHPGFVTREMVREEDGLLRAEFLGGVKPSCFAGAGVRLFYPEGASAWSFSVVTGEPKRTEDSDALSCVLKLRTPGRRIPAGVIGMWDLPDATISGEYFMARVCDDLAGAAAMLCMLDEVCRREIREPFSLLFTRGEEIGFLGAIAAIEDGTLATSDERASWSVVGLENSRALPQAQMGNGPVVRVGDRTGIFSSALTRFIKLCADDLADGEPEFHYQRALMDGGTCNSTVFDAAGFDSAGLTLPLANYHNMLSGEEPCSSEAPRAGEKIAAEAIHVGDFTNLVELMLQLVSRFHAYTGDHRGLQEQFRDRLSRWADQLYATARVHRQMDG
ncbi:MAG: hypothetical protein ACP5O1_06285 [Phycisphaerae bacterium]